MGLLSWREAHIKSEVAKRDTESPLLEVVIRLMQCNARLASTHEGAGRKLTEALDAG